mgnify:CR=1 FL=1
MKCQLLSGNLRIGIESKEVTRMKKTEAPEKQSGGFVRVSTMVEELEKDLPAKPVSAAVEKQALSTKETILDILARAADDHKFLARLAENPDKVLQEYDLTLEERAALVSGDLRRIESWVGKLDKRLSTWIWCRLQQEKW